MFTIVHANGTGGPETCTRCTRGRRGRREAVVDYRDMYKMREVHKRYKR